MTSFTRKFKSDKSIWLEVDGSFRFESQNLIEIAEVTAWKWSDRNNVAAPTFELTADELDRLHEDLMADPSTWEYPDDYPI